MSICEFHEDGIMHSQAKAFIVSFSTTDDPRHFHRLSKMAIVVLHKKEARNTLAKHGGLVLLGNRLLQALRDRRAAEKASLVSNVMRLLLRCNDKYTEEFIDRIGIDLVCEVIDFLQTYVEGTPEIEQLHFLLYDLASLPWSTLPDRRYGCLVQVLQGTVREPTAPRICATAICFLAELADNAAKKRYLVEYPGLVEDVLETISEHGGTSKEVALFSCRFLRRLAWNSPNRAALARKKLWDQALLKLTTRGGNMVREEALQTLWQMAIDSESRRRMVEHEEGKLVRHLVESLDCPGSDEATVSLLSALVNAASVKQLVASSLEIFDRLSAFAEEREATQGTEAVKILKRMASHISVRDNGHSKLMDALLRCAGSSKRPVRNWAAKGLLAQSELSTNAFFIARSKAVLQALIALSNDTDPGIRKSAIQALLNTASEGPNTRRAAFTTQYLHAFISNTTYNDNTNEQALSATRMSIRGILKLSDHPKSYHRVAKQNGAIESLARYGVSSDTDEELKGAALHAVVLLSPYL